MYNNVEDDVNVDDDVDDDGDVVDDGHGDGDDDDDDDDDDGDDNGDDDDDNDNDDDDEIYICPCHKKHFVRACAVEMHMDMSQEAFCAEIYKEKAVGVSRGQHFVQACAVEMHMDMSQERKFIGKIPKASDATSIEQRASTLTVKTPQCGHTVWGK